MWQSGAIQNQVGIIAELQQVQLRSSEYTNWIADDRMVQV